MTEKTWDAFRAARTRYRDYCEDLTKRFGPGGAERIQQLVDGREGPAYTVQTPVLYNYALDDITRESSPRLILVADNPGRREQAAENRRYLVGPSGKIAERFFGEQLGIDFRADVIILNKTPVHTPRTALLRELCGLDEAITGMMEESQRVMAELLAAFQQALSLDKVIPVWITGYSEMKKGGIFEVYTETLKSLYTAGALRERLFFYRHFSMNQFTIDLHKQRRPKEDLAPCLERMGVAYRQRVLGF
ncbi:MAG: hypothetical protein LBJ31_10790 [Treponema sp.]|nr:hypothetical protein [Treponema sp.]